MQRETINLFKINTMKKLATLVGAVILGFMVVSCSTPNPTENILKEVGEFFSQAEAKLQAIDNPGDLMAFINSFAEEKDNFGANLDKKYGANEEGIYKGLNAEGMESLFNQISERATQYNKAEYAKCGEIMEPFIARIEKAVNALYENFQAGKDVDDSLVEEYLDGVNALSPYADIVPEELADRYYKVDSLMSEMFEVEE